MNNKEIEELLKEEKIFKWQIAKKLGIHETTFVRWFRDEISEEQLKKIHNAISLIKADKSEDTNHVI